MSNVDVIRAWKDAEYRDSLSAEQRALLPQNPALDLVINDRNTAGISAPTTKCSPCTAAPTGFA